MTYLLIVSNQNKYFLVNTTSTERIELFLNTSTSVRECTSAYPFMGTDYTFKGGKSGPSCSKLTMSLVNDSLKF